MSANCPAKGSRTEVSFFEESELGVRAGDEGQVVPFISHSINLSKEEFDDPSIRGDRQKRFHRHGNRNVAGDLTIAYSHEAFDMLFESIFMNKWAEDELKIGQQGISLTMQALHRDKEVQFVHRGLRANTYSMEVNTSGVVQSSFGFVGVDTSTPTTPIDDAPTPSPNKQPYTHLSGVFREGNQVNGVITSIQLDIENNLTADYALGSDNAICISSEMLTVTGTLVAKFRNMELYNKFVNEQTSALEFTINDGNGNSHNWKLPQVKYTAAEVPVSDGGSLTVTLPFVALYDEARGTTVELNRS